MLILTRRVSESLRIGEDGDIIVTVLGIKGNQVRLGVGAPPEVSVHRSEIYKRIQEEKRNEALSKISFPTSVDKTSAVIDMVLKESNISERVNEDREIEK